MLSLAFIAVTTARAAVELLPEEQAPAVFGAGPRSVTIGLHNGGPLAAEVNLHSQLFQASAATLMPLADVRPWKRMTIPAGQTALATFEVDLPAVRGESRFQLVWFDGARKIGTTKVRVYPDGILKLLGSVARDQPVGLVDPEGQWKAGVFPGQTLDLKEAEEILSAETSLILVAPMTAKNRPAGLSAALKKKAGRGTGVVWLQAQSSRETLEWAPPVFVVEEGAGHIVVANGALAANMASSPRAQLNLVRWAELAAGQRKLALPLDTAP